MIATQAQPTQAEMHRATLARDASYDGLFYVCVKTTGIFCRPSCPARKPLPANMTFRTAVRACLLDGYRPCKRCRPLEVGRDPEWVATLLNRVEQGPCDRLSDGDLRELGLSPHKVRRYFSQNFGMTFQAYHRGRRMGMALEEIRRGGDSLLVGLDHGFDSASGFREAFEKTFGTSPGRSAGIRCIKTCCVETPIGPMVAAAVDEGICMLEFADRRALQKQIASLRSQMAETAPGDKTSRNHRPAAVVPGTNDHLIQIGSELGEYFIGKRSAFQTRFVAPGTAFQRKVWDTLRTIPFGETWSYDRLAKTVGCPAAARAVGRANGDNRIAILIPCHRVVRADGTLGGYGGGKWRKQVLLDLESGQRSFSCTP